MTELPIHCKSAEEAQALAIGLGRVKTTWK
jgi:hypothetical protein